jgi:hypothetical protein
MKYTAEMTSRAMIYIPWFVKAGWGVKKLLEGYSPPPPPTQTPRCSHKPPFLVYFITKKVEGTRGSVVCWGTMLQAGRSRIQFTIRSLDFSIDLILPATMWLWGRLSL